MRAICLREDLQIKEMPPPIPGYAEAQVRVHLAGICNTDLELVKGYMGFEGVLGHEFVGVVESSEDESWIGHRVCGEINFGCGECSYCRSGFSRHCPQRTVLGILNQNGAFADYVTIPIENLHLVPETVADSSAVFVEPLAAALEIHEQIQVQPNHRVAVVGDGKLGLLICQTLTLTGCDLRLVGKHARKMALAESWGIETIRADVVDREQFDIVVEASGSSSGFETALELIKPRGTIVLKSTYHGKLEIAAAPIVINEIRIVGSRCGPFQAAVRTLEKELVRVQDLVDTTYSADDALTAFEHAARKDSLKILLRFYE